MRREHEVGAARPQRGNHREWEAGRFVKEFPAVPPRRRGRRARRPGRRGDAARPRGAAALPAHGPEPHARRADDHAPAAGADRLLHRLDRRGGGGARLGRRDARDRLDLPCYREHGAALLRGMPLVTFVCDLLGNAGDVMKGRQMPCHEAWRRSLHPRSLAHLDADPARGRRRLGRAAEGRRDGRAYVLGEGGTSAHDFHTGLNFAAAGRSRSCSWHAATTAGRSACRGSGRPAPRPSRRRRSRTACAASASTATTSSPHAATRRARARAAAGEGPTLIECVTYRVEGHSTSDDPRVYRPAEPSSRGRRRIRSCACAAISAAEARSTTPRTRRSGRRSARSQLQRVLKEAEAFAPKPPIESLFEDVYAEPAPHLREQLTELEAAIAADPRVANPRHRLTAAEASHAHDEHHPGGERRPAPRDAPRPGRRGARRGRRQVRRGIPRDAGALRRVRRRPRDGHALAEGGIVGTAVGMALPRPPAHPEIQFADFIFPAFDQIVNEVAKYRYRSGGQYACPMVIRTPYGGGIRGGHYHSQSPETHFVHRGPEGGRPVEPVRREGHAHQRHPGSGSGAVLRAEARVPRREGRGARGRVRVPIGRARVTREGSAVTLVAWGATARGRSGGARGEGGGHRLRGHRPALAAAARHRDARRVGEEDRPRHRGARGAAHLRLRRGARGHPAGGASRTSRRPSPA